VNDSDHLTKKQFIKQLQTEAAESTDTTTGTGTANLPSLPSPLRAEITTDQRMIFAQFSARFRTFEFFFLS
jgi:hypothetical protein